MTYKEGEDCLFMGQRTSVLRTFDELGNEISFAALPDDQVLLDFGGEWKLVGARDSRLRMVNEPKGISAEAMADLLNGI
jgi:hypothetical protein